MENKRISPGMISFIRNNFLKIIYIAIFFCLVGVSIWQIFFNFDKFLIQDTDDYQKEYVVAFEWLRHNSQPNKVVITEWTQGHQVVNIAGRPVIATTKVYPSEAKEATQRYQDLARFFIAPDEKTALDIASKYGARYVFLRKKFDLASTFKKIPAVEKQKVIINNELSRYGLNNTMLGKMLQRYKGDNFKLVFESRNFLIYKITDKDDGLLLSDKKYAIKLARDALFNYLNFGKKITADKNKIPKKLLEKKQVDVTIWKDGNLRGSHVVLGENIAQSIIEAAIYAADDPRFKNLGAEELNSAVIEVFIFGEKIPLAKPFLENQDFLGNKGFFLKGQGGSGYFLPSVLIRSRYTLETFLDRLCQEKANLPLRCWQDEKTEIYVFDVEDFIEDKETGGILDLARTTAVAQSDVSAEELKKSVIMAAEWLVKMQQSDGYFTIYFKPFERTNEADEDLLRNAAAIWSLFEAYQKFGQSAFLNSALLGLDYLHKNSVFSGQGKNLGIKETSALPTGTLNFSLLSLLDAYKTLRSPIYLEEAKKTGDFLLGLQNANGSFKSHYGGGIKVEKNDDIYDNQAIFALVKLFRYSQDGKYLEAAKRAFDFQKTNFQEKRQFDKEQSIAVYAWLVNASRELYEIDKDENTAKFGIEVADWLMDYQRFYGPKVEIGAFQNTTKSKYVYTAGTAKAAEALADAFYLARNTGLATDKYLISFKNAIRWLSQMQYSEKDSYYLSTDVYNKIKGGFKTDYLNRDARIDYASHYLLAGIGLLNIVEQK